MDKTSQRVFTKMITDLMVAALTLFGAVYELIFENSNVNIFFREMTLTFNDLRGPQEHRKMAKDHVDD